MHAETALHEHRQFVRAGSPGEQLLGEDVAGIGTDPATRFMPLGDQAVMREREMADVGHIDDFGEYPVLAGRRQRVGDPGLLRRRSGEHQAQGAITRFFDQPGGEGDMCAIDAQADTAIAGRQQSGKGSGGEDIVPAEFEVEQTSATGSRCCGGDSRMCGISRRDGENVETVMKHCRSPFSLTRPPDSNRLRVRRRFVQISVSKVPASIPIPRKTRHRRGDPAFRRLQHRLSPQNAAVQYFHVSSLASVRRHLVLAPRRAVA